jgi:Flp pilus assembly protein protease CpaA
VLSYYDLRWRILPNWLTLGGAAVALAGRLGFGGWPLLLDGFAAAAGAGAFLFLPFLLRGAGGGDVKMLFAAGAIVGWGKLLLLLWVTSLAGLVMGVLMLVSGHLNGARLKHLARCAFDWRYDRQAEAAVLPPKESAQVRIPFSVPIAVGLIVALVW